MQSNRSNAMTDESFDRSLNQFGFATVILASLQVLRPRYFL